MPSSGKTTSSDAAPGAGSPAARSAAGGGPPAAHPLDPTTSAPAPAPRIVRRAVRRTESASAPERDQRHQQYQQRQYQATEKDPIAIAQQPELLAVQHRAVRIQVSEERAVGQGAVRE